MVDHDRLARELVRALRGRRSQTALSRRLGYKSNVIYAWEAGRRAPTAAEWLRVAERTGVDVRASLHRFYRDPPAWLADADLTAASTVAAVLRDWQGQTPIRTLCERSGLSRFAVSRILAGKAEPKLSQFLRLVEATSLRLLDFVAGFVDPDTLPAAKAAWERLEAQRRLAYELPWTQAVLRALELDAYKALPEHVPGWIAARIGIPSAVEDECIDAGLLAGAIKRRGRHLEPAEVLAVDTRRDPAAGRRNKGFWAEVGLARLRAGVDGNFSYNVFTVSDDDLVRLRELHLGYFRALRAIVAESQPGERVVVANLQLFALDGGAPA